MNAVLISINEEYKEFKDLANTLDIKIVHEYIQRRRHPDSISFIGKGKLNEIKDALLGNEIGVVLVNGILKPLQHYSIEQTLKTECLDRVGLILRIFKLRAKTPEAKIQVELAKLKYEMPLLKEWIHRSKSGEHPGFMSGGEYGIDIYYDLIKKRLIKISQEIEKIRLDRKIQRSKRRNIGCKNVSFIGYTNAGKSTLFNILTKNNVFIDDKLFSTLETTSRRIDDSTKTNIVLTDTIGFIEDMPYWLIESFQATLEEIRESDCLLWIIDGFDEQETIKRKYLACKDVIGDITNKIIPVVTKIDLIPANFLSYKYEIVEKLIKTPPIGVSSITNDGIERLCKTLIDVLEYRIKVQVRISRTEDTNKIISKFYYFMDIIDIKHGERIKITAWCNKDDIIKIKSICKKKDCDLTIEQLDS